MRRQRLALALVILYPAVAGAQRTRLTLSGFNAHFGNSQLAEFDQGFLDATQGITYMVQQLGSDTTARTTSVYIRANAATMAGGKASSDCAWRRDDLTTWTPLSTTDAFVESRPLQSLGQNWSNALWLRCNLAWASDPPADNSVDITISLKVNP